MSALKCVQRASSEDCLPQKLCCGADHPEVTLRQARLHYSRRQAQVWPLYVISAFAVGTACQMLSQIMCGSFSFPSTMQTCSSYHWAARGSAELCHTTIASCSRPCRALASRVWWPSWHLLQLRQ